MHGKATYCKIQSNSSIFIEYIITPKNPLAKHGTYVSIVPRVYPKRRNLAPFALLAFRTLYQSVKGHLVALTLQT